MASSFYLAWNYLKYYWGRSLVVIACLMLLAVIPFALEVLLRESEQQLAERAATTPLIVGAKGSALDLAMSSLYFSDQRPEEITAAVARQVEETGLARAIPLHVRYKARGAPIVGTTIDYFEYRELAPASGRLFALLGECVLGAEAATRLGLKVGDSVISTPEALFNAAGSYPLKMKVVGVLSPNHTADDLAVFADLKTTWVIAGLGHGHQDLAGETDESLVLERSGDRVTASAKLPHYQEITAENLDSFHFHGQIDDYPLSAVIAIPRDDKAATILRGRFLDPENKNQIVDTREVIGELMQTVFRFSRIINAAIIVVGAGTLLAILLVFALSIRLRQREFVTNYRLGCSRATTFNLVAAEICIVFTVSLGAAAIAAMTVQRFAGALVRSFFIA